MSEHLNNLAADLTETALLKLRQQLRASFIMKPAYITPTDDNLRQLGWTEEAITELRKLEQQCLR